jgi:hypothetical protein
MVDGLTVEEMRALPASLDLETGGRCFRIGRSKSYELARSGEFPVPLIKVGSRYIVRRSDVLAALGVADQRVDRIAD